MATYTEALRIKISADTKGVNRALKQTTRSVSTLTKAVIGLGAAFAAWKATRYIKDITMAAARYETLGIVMKTVGKNAGYTSEQMTKWAKSLEETGISMAEARQSLARMASAQLDLAKSSELARIAQDAAVIGNINSSEAFQRLVHGIRSARVIILRTIGIQVEFERGYKKLAKTLGKTTAELSVQEKAQSRLNQVLEYGKRIQGTYEAAMTTAGKKVLSLTRYFQNLQVVLGKVFQPAFVVLIDHITDRIKGLIKKIQELEKSGRISQWASEARGKVILLIRKVESAVKTFIKWAETIKSVAKALIELYIISKITALVTSATLVIEGLATALTSAATAQLALNSAAKTFLPILAAYASYKLGELFTYWSEGTFKTRREIEELRAEIARTTIKIKAMEDATGDLTAAEVYEVEWQKKYIEGLKKLFTQWEKEEALTKKRIEAGEKFYDAYDKAVLGSTQYEILQLDKLYDKHWEHVQDKTALNEWYAKRTNEILAESLSSYTQWSHGVSEAYQETLKRIRGGQVVISEQTWMDLAIFGGGREEYYAAVLERHQSFLDTFSEMSVLATEQMQIDKLGLERQYLEEMLTNQKEALEISKELWGKDSKQYIEAATNKLRIESDLFNNTQKLIKARIKMWQEEHQVQTSLMESWGVSFKDIQKRGDVAWRTVGSAVADASHQMSNALVDVVTRAKTVEEALVDLGKSLLRTVVETLVQIGVQQIILATVAKSTAATVIASMTAANLAALPAALALAAAQAAATFGAAPAAGAAAFATAMGTMGAISAGIIASTTAASSAAIAGSFAEGGRVEGSSPSRTADNIPIMSTAGEWMHPVDAVEYYGKRAMYAIQNRLIPKEVLEGYQAGGQVGGSYQAGGQVGGTGWANQLAALGALTTAFNPEEFARAMTKIAVEFRNLVEGLLSSVTDPKYALIDLVEVPKFPKELYKRAWKQLFREFFHTFEEAWEYYDEIMDDFTDTRAGKMLSSIKKLYKKQIPKIFPEMSELETQIQEAIDWRDKWVKKVSKKKRKGKALELQEQALADIQTTYDYMIGQVLGPIIKGVQKEIDKLTLSDVEQDLRGINDWYAEQVVTFSALQDAFDPAEFQEKLGLIKEAFDLMIVDLLASVMDPVRETLDKLTLSEYALEVKELTQWYDEQIAAIEALRNVLDPVKYEQAISDIGEVFGLQLKGMRDTVTGGWQDIINELTLSDYDLRLLALDEWREEQMEAAEALRLPLEDLNYAYQLQKDAILELEDAIDGTIKSIDDMIASLTGGALAPVQSAAFYQAQYGGLLEIARTAESADAIAKAVSDLNSFIPEYLNFMKSYGMDYASLTASIVTDLEALRSGILPTAQSGGITSGPTIAGTHGRELITPLYEPEMSALLSSLGAGGKEIHVHVEIDGREIAYVVANEANSGNIELIDSYRRNI